MDGSPPFSDAKEILTSLEMNGVLAVNPGAHIKNDGIEHKSASPTK